MTRDIWIPGLMLLVFVVLAFLFRHERPFPTAKDDAWDDMIEKEKCDALKMGCRLHG